MRQTLLNACTFAAVHKKETVKSITMGRLAHSYCPRNLEQERRQWQVHNGPAKRARSLSPHFVLAFAAFLWVAAPQLVPTAELLGSDWQCTKTAFVLTTCTLFPQPYTGTAQNHHDDKVAARTDAP